MIRLLLGVAGLVVHLVGVPGDQGRKGCGCASKGYPFDQSMEMYSAVLVQSKRQAVMVIHFRQAFDERHFRQEFAERHFRQHQCFF